MVNGRGGSETICIDPTTNPFARLPQNLGDGPTFSRVRFPKKKEKITFEHAFRVPAAKYPYVVPEFIRRRPLNQSL